MLELTMLAVRLQKLNPEKHHLESKSTRQRKTRNSTPDPGQNLTVNPKREPVVAKRPSDKALDQSCRAKFSNLEDMGMRMIG